MPTLVTLSGSVRDLIGDTFDPRRTKVWLTANADAIVDRTGNTIRLGDYRATVSDTGTFTFPDVIASSSTDINVTNLQYRLHVDYQPKSGGPRKTETFGWWTVTASANVAQLVAEQRLAPSYLSQARTEIQGYVEQARDISNIAVPDDVVSTLVEGTGGAGPLTRAALSASYAAKSAPKNIFTGKAEYNGGFANGYDTDVWIAGAQRVNPTNNSQGLYIQHRVTGDLGGLVHDAGASELRLNNASNTGAGQSAHENSLVVTGGVNNIGTLVGVLANFHTSGTPTGSASQVRLFNASQVAPLAAGFTVGTIYGLYLDQQIAGADNFSIYAPGGKSHFGPVTVKANTSVQSHAQQWQDSAGATYAAFDSSGQLRLINKPLLTRNAADTGTFMSLAQYLRWNDAGLTQTTVGAAGAAAALPAAPTKYLKVQDSTGTILVIPAYAVS